MKLMKKHILFSLVYSISAFGALDIKEDKIISCGVTHTYVGTVGDSPSAPILSQKNLMPWSTWKQDLYGESSWYGSGVKVLDVKIPIPVTYYLYNGKGWPANESMGRLNETMVSRLQFWQNQHLPNGEHSSARSILFTESEAPQMRIYLAPGDYSPGVYEGEISFQAFSGVIASDKVDNDFKEVFLFGVNHGGTVCQDKLRLEVHNSCSLTTKDIHYGNINAEDFFNSNSSSLKKNEKILFKCQLNDSVSLSLVGADNDNSLNIDMGHNVISNLKITNLQGKAIGNGENVKVKFGDDNVMILESSLSLKDNSGKLEGGDIAGSAIIRMLFN